MNKTICILIALILSFSAPMADGKRVKKEKKQTKAKTEYVYVCNGPRAYAYHRTPYCSGLNRCSTEVSKIGSM